MGAGDLGEVATMAEDKRPSEFGGRPGLVQRVEDGHVITENESRMGNMQTNSADPLSLPRYGDGGTKVQ